MDIATTRPNQPSSRGGGDNKAVTELGFAHNTTKTWASLGVFCSFRIFFVEKKCPPTPKSHFENTMGNQFVDFFNTDQNAQEKFRTKIISR